MNNYEKHPDLILEKQRLMDILESMNDIRACIIGDVALDVYWEADMTRSELSRETPHFPLPVVKERYSGGGCANVAANVSALKPAFVTIISMIGNDWRGELIIKALKDCNVNTTDLVVSEKRVTPAYCKPIRKGISDVEYEDPRIDFQNYSVLTAEEEARIISNLERVSGKVDVIGVADQMLYGIITEKVRDKLAEIARSGLPVIVDSRNRIGLFKGVIVKPNETEACRAINAGINPREINDNLMYQAAIEINRRNGHPVIITLGPRGAWWIEEGKITEVPTVPEDPPIDICGAGDTFLSAFSCAFAAGASGSESVHIANLASGVTVKKVGTTGTATRDEIIAKFEERTRK